VLGNVHLGWLMTTTSASTRSAWAPGTGYGSGSVRNSVRLDQLATEKLQDARDREILTVLNDVYNGLTGACCSSSEWQNIGFHIFWQN